jgi:hypothetical protein
MIKKAESQIGEGEIVKGISLRLLQAGFVLNKKLA